MAIWSRPLKWVKSKIRPARPAPPGPPPEPPRRPPRQPPRQPEPPDDGTFDRLHLAYLAGRLRELGMDNVTADAVDALVQEIGAKNAIRVLDKALERVRDYVADRPSPFADSDDPFSEWEDDAKDDIKRYTPKGQLPNYRALMPFWWYHPTRP